MNVRDMNIVELFSTLKLLVAELELRMMARTPDMKSNGIAYKTATHNEQQKLSDVKKKMWPANCSICGIETEVPFKPFADATIRCKDCYREMKKQERENEARN